MSDSLCGSMWFSYDLVGWLISCVNLLDWKFEEFVWDVVGNLFDDVQCKSCGYVEGNCLLMWQDLCFEYDLFGNLVMKWCGVNQMQWFIYDGQDCLIIVYM